MHIIKACIISQWICIEVFKLEPILPSVPSSCKLFPLLSVTQQPFATIPQFTCKPFPHPVWVIWRILVILVTGGLVTHLHLDWRLCSGYGAQKGEIPLPVCARVHSCGRSTSRGQELLPATIQVDEGKPSSSNLTISNTACYLFVAVTSVTCTFHSSGWYIVLWLLSFSIFQYAAGYALQDQTD